MNYPIQVSRELYELDLAWQRQYVSYAAAAFNAIRAEAQAEMRRERELRELVNSWDLTSFSHELRSPRLSSTPFFCVDSRKV